MNQRVDPSAFAVAMPLPAMGAAVIGQAEVRWIRKAVATAFPASGRRKPAEADPFRDEVLPRFERTRMDYLSLARRVALEISRRLRRPITVDDVRAVCPPPPEYDGRLMGAIFKGPDWVFVSYVRSERTTCHKRPIACFDRA